MCFFFSHLIPIIEENFRHFFKGKGEMEVLKVTEKKINKILIKVSIQKMLIKHTDNISNGKKLLCGME